MGGRGIQEYTFVYVLLVCDIHLCFKTKSLKKASEQTHEETNLE